MATQALAFKFEIVGLRGMKARFARLKVAFEGFEPFFRDWFVPYYYGQIAENFNAEGALVGGWAPLSDRYAEWKAEHYPGKGLLRRTDALYRSVSLFGSRPGAGGILEITRKEVSIGTVVHYGKWHQQGTASMPARPIFFSVRRIQADARRLFREYVTATIAKTKGAAA